MSRSRLLKWTLWLVWAPALVGAAVPPKTPLGGTVQSAGTPRNTLAQKKALAGRVADLLEEAYQLELSAQNKNADDEERNAMLQRAVHVLGRLLALDAHHAEARLALGRLLANHELGEDSLRRSVQELQRARLDDSPPALDSEIASLLGIVLSRLGRFEEAVKEYDRALAILAGQPGSPARTRSHRATLLGNSAEALMAMGKLREAIQRYLQAEALETTEQAALHTLGLAVAYDRDGQHEKSREAMTRSLTTDPAMRLFQSDAVFFVPAGDRHYYVGLAAETFGDRERALSAWQQFLRELPKSRYAARARVHLDELRRTPGLSATELARADVIVGSPMFPPDRAINSVGRRRTEEEIERVALDHRIELRQCYARTLRQMPKLSMELDVALILDRNGAVAWAEVMRVSIGEVASPLREYPKAGALPDGQGAKDLIHCAVSTIRRWRFAPSESEHDELALPLRFEAKDK